MVVPYSKAARGIHLAYTFYYRDGDQARQVPPAETPSFEAARAEAIVAESACWLIWAMAI